jgi:Putative transposase
LHAATHAGAHDQAGREALLRYVLRPPVAQERVELRPDGLVRITLKKAYADGTVAVDMDPLSLLCRLATSVPLPRFHTVRYAGMLAAASPWRSRIVPQPQSQPQPAAEATTASEPETPKRTGGYRPWAELLARTFAVDVLACPKCEGRMKLLAMVTDPASIARYLVAVGEAREVPRRSPNRGPPYGRAACYAARRSATRKTDLTVAGETTRRRGGATARGARGLERSARCESPVEESPRRPRGRRERRLTGRIEPV